MSRVDVENRILGTAATGAVSQPTAAKATVPAGGASFDAILQGRLSAAPDPLSAQAARANVKFSGHAQTRLASRGITLSEGEIAKLGEAITRASAKGARESLVLTDQAALVVSVRNRTVITAVDKSSLKENIFTNIDSAMIL